MLWADLRRAVAKLPPLSTLKESEVEAEWLEHESRLRQFMVQRDPLGFLHWDLVWQTMFGMSQAQAAMQLVYLSHQPDWESRWLLALLETVVGAPALYSCLPHTSGNLLGQAYHLARWEQKTGKRIADMATIFEFGGGYGAMCRLAYRLGFRGDYVLFDLPAFSLLQHFFLANTRIYDYVGPRCISDLEELRLYLSSEKRWGPRLFIALWSISEAPIARREVILDLASNCDAFLIAYQERFGDIDNLAFFKEWSDNQARVNWFDWRIGGSREDRYLMGGKENATVADRETGVFVGQAATAMGSGEVDPGQYRPGSSADSVPVPIVECEFQGTGGASGH